MEKLFLGFKKTEFKATLLIFTVLVVATLVNLQTSLRRGRDSQRKADLGNIRDQLVAYHEDVGTFPLSSADGEIVACPTGETDKLGSPVLGPCKWFYDALKSPDGGKTYLTNIPTDPHHDQGARYRYMSNGKRFQIYGALEGTDEPEVRQEIISRSLLCGNLTCNFGTSYSNTPLDKSLEEYENELRK